MVFIVLKLSVSVSVSMAKRQTSGMRVKQLDDDSRICLGALERQRERMQTGRRSLEIRES